MGNGCGCCIFFSMKDIKGSESIGLVDCPHLGVWERTCPPSPVLIQASCLLFLLEGFPLCPAKWDHPLCELSKLGIC